MTHIKIYKLRPEFVLMFLLPLGLGQRVFSQDESSPIQQQKEKQSETRKIKTCTGTYFSYDKNGIVSKSGHRSSVESYDKAGNLTETILYSPDEKVSETTQCKYDSTGKLAEEKKIIPNLPTQKHVYYYKNGLLDYGKVFMDTALVHTCTYKYENKRLFEIITEHHLLIEKNIPPVEAIIYKYDPKGYKVKEEDYEIELSPEKLGSDSGNEKPNYRIKKLISHINFTYDKDSHIVESQQYEGQECTGRSEFKYDAKGNMTEEIYYKSCTEKQNPEYAVKYEYSYY